VATREPGGAEGAEVIRKLLVAGDPGRWDAMTELMLAFRRPARPSPPHRLAGARARAVG